MFDFAQPTVSPPEGKKKGWLLTNGIGGFAASTISGINTRRYHGLLVASFKPPVDRRLLLAKLEEELFVDGKRYSLFCSETLGGVSGRGFDYLIGFRRYPFPTYIYQVEDVFLEKEIMMVRGQNTVLIRYRLINENSRHLKLGVFPLVSCRDYHWTTRQTEWPFTTSISGQGAVVQAYAGAPFLHLAINEGKCEKTGYWYYNVYYKEEAFRGLDSVEDLFCPLRFEVNTKESLTVWVAAGTCEISLSEDWAEQQRKQEIRRMQEVIEMAGIDDEHFRVLALAADSFLVKRQGKGMTVIAGYPWFADWGRDAMIALPGLTLTTGRFEDFRQVLRTFLSYEKAGLVPNLFADSDSEPHYNTVDASLWVFWSLYKYWQYTKDKEFLVEMFPALQSIITHYMNGTVHNIKMDDDGLISQGEAGKSLTWMDARVDGESMTPRPGKPVEINALWHFALLFMAFIAREVGPKGWGQNLEQLAHLVKTSFQREFWYEEGGYLYDVVAGSEKDRAIRCNQIIACSLPVSILLPNQEREVIKTVWRYLYTGAGLRTLAPHAPNYCGRYKGNRRERDRAYHQGTVWVWPWGHFVTAFNRHYNNGHKKRITKIMIAPLLAHLSDVALGSVSEIFDGDPPHYPQGCFAQAWSVAEVLRILYEEVLVGVKDVIIE